MSAAPRDELLGDLENLYRRRFPEFLHVATAIVRDEERARDAVQDAFAGAVRSLDTFRGDGTLEAWIWRIVLNAARRERARRPQPVPEPTRTREDLDGRGDAVRAALAKLTERQRQVVFLRYYADLDYATIGEALGISAGTVGATINRAHAALRSRLEETRP